MPTLDAGNLHFQGVSIGGLETCIELPALKLAFDIGRCPPTAVPRTRVLFTHPHMDHMGGVAMHTATRALLGMGPPTYIVPREVAGPFAALIDAWRALDGSELRHELVPLGPGDEFDLGGGMLARPFRTSHRVPSQGYLLVRRGKRLLESLRGLPQNEIQSRKHRGEVIEEPVETLELAYAGDSRIEVLTLAPEILQARVLWLECTFLDNRVSVERSREMGHTHLDEVIEHADRFENELLVLGHFSARYSAQEIAAILARRLPASLRERTLFFPPTRD